MTEYYETHQIVCYTCDIKFRTVEERTTHNRSFHERYNSTDNMSVKQYIGKKKEVKQNPLICVQHQCVIGDNGCGATPLCGHYTKDVYCEVDISDFKNIISSHGKDSETFARKIISKLNMDENKVKDLEVIDIIGDMAKVRISLSIGDGLLNIWIRLDSFKKMIREKNGIEVKGKLYYMEENRIIDVDGIRILVKVF